ncbi:MAG: hypothetical protein ACR2JB_02245, partial [Bryobacteraceae bacterium]
MGTSRGPAPVLSKICSGAFTVFPWEDQNEFDMLLGSLRDEHKPSGLTETILVDKMAQAIWLSKRALMLQ